MIEIVYKEEKKEANGNQSFFHLPKNKMWIRDSNIKESDTGRPDRACVPVLRDPWNRKDHGC